MYIRARKGVGYLPQQPSVFTKMTVENNIISVLETLNLDKKQQYKQLDKILDDLHVKNDSRLGKKILTFVTNEHFYRSDTIEAMYVKEQYENEATPF